MVATRRLIAVDIGGTHARFAIARIGGRGRPKLEEPVTLRTRDHASLATAWQAFARERKGRLPKLAAICVAAPLHGAAIKLTNCSWVIHPGTLAGELGLDDILLLNDFGAMAWAVSQLEPGELEPVCGPETGLPNDGVISVIGPGTGLGVAQLIRRGGQTVVVETEGGHLDYAPLDQLETTHVDRLREKFLRVSTERVVSGPALAHWVNTLAAVENQAYQPRSDADLWAAAISGEDPLATEALDRFCLAYGAVAGDLALAHGAQAVVLTGGLSQRILPILKRSDFALRFCAKGRFQNYMTRLSVQLARHPQPGLLGAAAAFAQR